MTELARTGICQATCNVSWPSMGPTCSRDYAAACPYGWLWLADDEGKIECRAPPMQRRFFCIGQRPCLCKERDARYRTCSPVQRFDGMSPHEKQAWERVCAQRFPCATRSSCEKDWLAACPAGWYEYNGGASCLAPRDYAGKCASVHA